MFYLFLLYLIIYFPCEIFSPLMNALFTVVTIHLSLAFTTFIYPLSSTLPISSFLMLPFLTHLTFPQKPAPVYLTPISLSSHAFPSTHPNSRPPSYPSQISPTFSWTHSYRSFQSTTKAPLAPLSPKIPHKPSAASIPPSSSTLPQLPSWIQHNTKVIIKLSPSLPFQRGLLFFQNDYYYFHPLNSNRKYPLSPNSLLDLLQQNHVLRGHHQHITKPLPSTSSLPMHIISVNDTPVPLRTEDTPLSS